MKLFWFLQSADSTARDDTNMKGSRIIIWGALLVLVTFCIWASLAELDEVTRGSGSVIPSSRIQLIQSQDGGVLESLHVREGEMVKQGQLLARIDETRAEASYLESRAKYASLTAQVARLTAEALGTELHFTEELDDYAKLKENQIALMQRRHEALNEEVAALEHVRALMQEELDLNRPLLASGDVSRTELIRLERQVAEITAEITNARTAFFREVQGELSEVQSELSSVTQQMRQRNNVLEQTILYAPLRGIVKNLEVTTIGGVVRPGGTVMEIVPIGDDLLIEGKVKPSDIAFLHLGQAASVKVDAYDFSIYGHLPGELVFISADTMVEEESSRDKEPYYRVRIRTGRQFTGLPNRQLEILPGMTATVEIKTGRRTVMHYLTKPIIKTLDESLTES